jgi:hypothetical protein
MISNPNSEVRMSKEVRIPKSETAAPQPASGEIELVHSGFGILSDFGLRASDFCSGGR